MLVKVVNIFFFLNFLVAAALQYNDPDPYVWMPIYLYAAILCLLAFRHRFFPRAYITGIIIYALYAIYLFFTNDGVMDWIVRHNAINIAGTMKATMPWIEQTREFFGLLICICALLLNYYFARKHSRTIAV